MADEEKIADQIKLRVSDGATDVPADDESTVVSSTPGMVSKTAGDRMPKLDNLLFQKFGNHYQLTDVIGKGGMSIVFRAHHELLNQDVAVKLLLPDRYLDERAIQRFQVEAQANAGLTSPNTVRLREYGVADDGRPYIIADLVEGTNLAEAIAEQEKLPEEQVIKIALDVCNSLQEAHAKGIIHRDVKPSNIMVMKDSLGREIAKVLDFGIAKSLLPGSEMQHLTETGEMVGSPLYMSPEQCQGKALDQRSDIYSLGCVLYECLTGRPPLRGANALQTMTMHAQDPIEPLSCQTPGLAQIVMRCLQKNPDARYMRISDLIADLNNPANVPGARTVRSSSKVNRKFIAIAAAFLLIVLAAPAGLRTFNDWKWRQEQRAVLKDDIVNRLPWQWLEPYTVLGTDDLSSTQMQEKKRLSTEIAQSPAKHLAVVQVARDLIDLTRLELEERDFQGAKKSADRALALLNNTTGYSQQELQLAQSLVTRSTYLSIAGQFMVNGLPAGNASDELALALKEVGSVLNHMRNNTSVDQNMFCSALLDYGNLLYLSHKVHDAKLQYLAAFALPSNEDAIEASFAATGRARLADCLRIEGNKNEAIANYERSMEQWKRALSEMDSGVPDGEAKDFAAVLTSKDDKEMIDDCKRNIAVAHAFSLLLRFDNSYVIDDQQWWDLVHELDTTFTDPRIVGYGDTLCYIFDAIGTRALSEGNEKLGSSCRARARQLRETIPVMDD